MNNKDISLTDEIYQALVDGLKTGLDWPHFLAEYGASKGPLYNAFGRFQRDMEPKVREFATVQAKLDEAGLELDSLDQQIKEAESSLAPLEETKNALNEGIETLETKLTEKSELLEHAGELGKLNFDIERLRQLKDALTEIGAKHGLKGKEAVTKFFSDLLDYDAKTGFEQEIKRLETIIRTKTLEAEKWQAEADSLERRHKDLSEAIAAVQSLIKHGVKTEQIVSWDGIISKLGGSEELQDKLERYKSMSELIDAKKTKMEDCDKKVIELGAQIKALNEQKVEIEGAIKSLSTSGVKEIAKVSDKAMAVLKSLSNDGGKEIIKVSGKAVTGITSLSTSSLKEVTRVSDKAIAEIKALLAEIRVEAKRLSDLKAEAGKLEKELRYARYFTTGDQAVLKELPKELVLIFLERAAIYCKLNELNPVVKMPDGIRNKFPLFYGTSEVTLLEIIAWAEAGLAGAV